MTARIHVDELLRSGTVLVLPAAQSRHVQVLRLQPGSELLLFNGRGGEWQARITGIGRSEVAVEVGAYIAVDRELPQPVTLALGMPANERMDAFVEKATELGVAAIQPLVCERSVLRLSGERAVKRQAHWQAVATAAAEQSGRTRVPGVAAVQPLRDWLAALGAQSGASCRYLLSPHAEGRSDLAAQLGGAAPLLFLSGPEGGLTVDEEAAAQRCGFAAIALGPRVLRADTAPLAILAWCGLAALVER